MDALTWIKSSKSRRFLITDNPADGEFFMLTIGVGIDGEPALIDGAPVEPWSVLNEYNRKTLG